MSQLITFLLLLALPIVVSAQNFVSQIDSLKRELANPMRDTTRVQLMQYLSQLYFHRQMDSSIHYAQKSLALARKIHYTEGELNGIFSLAKTLSDRDIPRSMALYYEVIERSPEAGIENLYRIAGSYNGIGELHSYLRNSRQSIENYRKARRIVLDLKDTAFVSGIDMWIAEALYIAGELDSARYYLTIADKEYPISRKSPRDQAYYFYGLGQAESARNPTLALHYFQQSIRTVKGIPSFRTLSLSYSRLGDFYLQRNQPDSAISSAREGLQAAQQHNFYRGIYDNSTILAEAYKRQQRIDSAYHYQSIMVVARDSLFSFDKMNRTQTAIINEQQRTQQVEDEKSRIKLYGSLALIVGLFVLTGILYRNNQQKQRANALLQRQRDEIHEQRTKAENTLTELRATQVQLVQKEKLASLGELTAGIAHEIQNPLNFVNNFSEVSTELMEELEEELDKGDTDEAIAIAKDVRQNLQKIHHHGGRAAAIVRGMLEHSRIDSGEKRPTDLNALAEEYLKIAYHGLKVKDKNFDAELITDVGLDLGQVEVVPQEIGRVLVNLYNNAFYAVGQRQHLAEEDYHPTVKVSTKRLANTVEIWVEDNGTGIPDTIKAKIFQPFFTTKPTGKGTGLGLSLSYDIVTKGHGGTLTVESVEGEGTTFLVSLPIR